MPYQARVLGVWGKPPQGGVCKGHELSSVGLTRGCLARVSLLVPPLARLSLASCRTVCRPTAKGTMSGRSKGEMRKGGEAALERAADRQR